MEKDERYIPAFDYDRLTPLFDSVLRWSMRELELKRPADRSGADRTRPARARSRLRHGDADDSPQTDAPGGGGRGHRR